MTSEILPIEPEAPLKKPELDADETSLNSHLSGISSDDEAGFEHMKDKTLIEEYRKYMRQVNESDGFDIDFVPRKFRRILGSHILPCKLHKPKEQELIQEFTDFAIDEYNRLMKPLSQLELLNIVKANRRRSYNYECYITFEAFDTVSKQFSTYQTEVVSSPQKDDKEMFLIRRKGQKKGILFPVDFGNKEDYEKIKKCTDCAVAEYSEMQEGNHQLQLVQILKAVQDTFECRDYRIAFEAMDTISRQTNTYYAIVTYVFRREEIIAVDDVWLKGEMNHDFSEFEELEWKCSEDGASGCI